MFDIDTIPIVLSKPRLVFEGFDDIRGVACDPLGRLYLSDINRAFLYQRRRNEENRTESLSELFMRDNGFIAGMIFDWEENNENLIVCQSGAKQVSRLSLRDLKVTPLATMTPEGMPFNSPNDLVMDSWGGIYFTDPDYKHKAERALEQGVYYIPPTGGVLRVIDNLHRPNGIAIAPDESTLYVTPSSGNALVSYPILSPGMVGTGRILAELPTPGDGITTDVNGNIYVTQPRDGKVLVYSNEGALLPNALPAVGTPTDVDFGGVGHNWLFVTTRNALYAFEMNTTGYRAWKPDIPFFLMEEENRLKLPFAFGQMFMEGLTQGKLEQLGRAWNGPEHMDYSYLADERDGLPLDTLTKGQRIRANMLIQSVLEPEAYEVFKQIQLVESEAHAGGRQDVDADKYWITFFGTPDQVKPWGWKFEGHHISLNTTYKDGKIASVTPMFLGAQPEVISIGTLQGTRPLGREGAKGAALLASLDDAQRTRAIVSDTAPSNIETPMGSAPWNLDPAGLPASDMTSEQRVLLMDLVRLYVERAQSDYAKDYMANVVEPVADELVFTWKGSTDPDEAHYFRVLGPEFVFEYNDGQSTLDHVHTAWRDRVRDYGAHLETPVVQGAGATP